VPHYQVNSVHLSALQAEELELQKVKPMTALKGFDWLLVTRLSSTNNIFEVLILCGLEQGPSKKLATATSKLRNMSKVIKEQDWLWRDLALIKNL
jgi:hypothetical protein